MKGQGQVKGQSVIGKKSKKDYTKTERNVWTGQPPPG